MSGNNYRDRLGFASDSGNDAARRNMLVAEPVLIQTLKDHFVVDGAAGSWHSFCLTKSLFKRVVVFLLTPKKNRWQSICLRWQWQSSARCTWSKALSAIHSGAAQITGQVPTYKNSVR